MAANETVILNSNDLVFQGLSPYEIAKTFFEDNGYYLFLVGYSGLLPIDSFFLNGQLGGKHMPSIENGRERFIEGNVLAMHGEWAHWRIQRIIWGSGAANVIRGRAILETFGMEAGEVSKPVKESVFSHLNKVMDKEVLENWKWY